MFAYTEVWKRGAGGEKARMGQGEDVGKALRKRFKLVLATFPLPDSLLCPQGILT